METKKVVKSKNAGERQMIDEGVETRKAEIMASFIRFSKGKKTEDFFPESNKRALENLIRAGLLEP